MALIRELNKESLKKEWRAASFLLAQFAVVVLIVVQFFAVVGFRVNFLTKQAFFALSEDPADFIVLAIAVILFILLYFAVKKRQPNLYRAQKIAPGIIKQEARQKLRKAKEEPQAAALLLIEFMFVIVAVFSMQAYLDPDLELIPWSQLNLKPPVTTVLNAAIALIVLAAFYCLYRFTAPYRKGSVAPNAPGAIKKKVSASTGKGTAAKKGK